MKPAPVRWTSIACWLAVAAASGGVGAAVLVAGVPAHDAVMSTTRRQAIVAFDGARAFEHLRQVVAIGPRPAGSPALARTRTYITRQMAAIGVPVIEQPFDAETPHGRVRMVNLRVILPGTEPGRLLIGGHYDTKWFTAFRFVGANDAGSSTAFLIELARVLKDRPRRLTIELVFFDGEEAVVEWGGTDRTYGSRHYVDAATRRGERDQIRGLLLVDMIGDRDLRLCREPQSTRWMTDIIWGSAARLGLQDVFVDEELVLEDDHLPFLEAGIPAVDLIDFGFPAWHTAADTLDQVSARSLETVATVVLASLPLIEQQLLASR